MRLFPVSLFYKALFAVAVILLPILITFIHGYRANKEHLKKHILEDMTIIAEAYEGQVYQFLEMSKRRAQDFSSDGAVKDGLQKITNGNTSEVKTLSNYLSKHKLTLDKTIKHICILSLDGRVRASTDSSAIGRFFLHEQFFLKGAQGPSVSEGKTGASMASEIVVSAPIVSRDTGKPIGALANFLRLKDINKLLSGEFNKEFGAISWDKGNRKTLEVYLVNKDKLMLTGSLFVKDAVLRQTVDTLPVNECLKSSNEITAYYKDYRGVEVAGASMCLPAFGWTLLAEIDADEVLVPARDMLRDTMTGALVVIGLVLLLFITFFRGILNRILRISHASASLARGDYSVSIPIESGDEIGVLAVSFNKMAVDIRERTALLMVSEEKLRAIIDNSTAIIYLKDAEGKYMLINSRWEILFNLTSEQVIGKTDYDIFPEIIAHTFRQNDLKVLEANTPLEFDEAAPNHDGLHHYISIKFPLLNSNGIPYAVCGISTDITERKLAEERLKEAQRLAKVGNWNWDIVNNKLSWSDEIYRTFGLKPQEFGATYEAFLNYVHPGDRKFVTIRMNEALNNKRPYSIDHRIVLPDGKEKIVHEEAVVTFDEKRAPTRMDGTVQDITERKLAEEAVIELKDKYEGLVNNIALGIYRRNVDGRLLEVNQAAVKMFETDSKEELLKHNVIDFYQDKSRLKDVNDRLLKYGFIKSEEIETVTAKGRRFWSSVSSVMKRDKNGHIYLDGVVEDITEKKGLADQLRQSQKMEAIGQLAGGIAHDFNNILTAIIGYGNLLLMKRKEDELLKNYINQILTLSEKAAHLTQGLLAFSRKQMIKLQIVELNDIIKRVEKILARVISENIELKTNLTDKEIIVKADSVQIEQVLMNLATNARDAMPAGGVLSISTELVEMDNEFINQHGYGTPGRYALITVSDNGMGMDEAARKKVFEPFFTTKEVGKGTGLGLSIVYGLIKQHKGYIDVHSEPGKGTAFKIYLPTTEKIAGQQEQPTLTADIKGGIETILLAEDEATVRETTKALLNEFGYTVIEAVNGEDAVSQFKENRDKIELLIFDMVMPKKNGKEAYEEIKKISPAVKIIYLSGYAASVMKGAILDSDANFISKPVTPNELLRKIREVVGK